MASRIRVYEPDQKPDERPVLKGENHHYLAHVHRVRSGDQVILFGNGNQEMICKVAAIGANKIELEPVEIRDAETEPRLNIALVVAIGKGKTLEQIVETTTALGVSHIIPFVGERSVTRKSNPRLLGRLKSIAVEASRQSGRTRVPTISIIAGSLKETLGADFVRDGRSVFMLDEDGGVPVQEAVKRTTVGGSLALFCGPEGGWGEAERTQLLDRGATAMSLGPRILRTELAAVVGVSFLERLLSE